MDKNIGGDMRRKDDFKAQQESMTGGQSIMEGK